MPAPKKKGLPEDKGIKPVELPATSGKPAKKNPNRASIYLRDRDKALLDEICNDLGAKLGVKVSWSEYVRWAIRKADRRKFDKN